MGRPATPLHAGRTRLAGCCRGCERARAARPLSCAPLATDATHNAELSSVPPRRRSPQFVLAVPKGAPNSGGFVTFVLQWQLPNLLFTLLEEIQRRGAGGAAPHLVVTHYPELADAKGLVFARGEVPSHGAHCWQCVCVLPCVFTRMLTAHALARAQS